MRGGTETWTHHQDDDAHFDVQNKVLVLIASLLVVMLFFPF